MLTVAVIAGSLWLLFNLFLFAWLGPAASRDLSLTAIANLRAAWRGERRA